MPESVALDPQPDRIKELIRPPPARASWRQPCLGSRSTAPAHGHLQAEPAAFCAFGSCRPLTWAIGRVHPRRRVREPELSPDCGRLSCVMPDLASPLPEVVSWLRKLWVSRVALRGCLVGGQHELKAGTELASLLSTILATS